MRKIYFFIGLLGLTQLGNSQTLSSVLTSLNANYSTVVSAVPTPFNFAYDGGFNSISDGGNDMYDGGNYINTNLASNIAYSDNSIIASGSFGAGGQYFTRHLPGLFVMAADLNNVSSFSITGNNGADGGGSTDGFVFSTTVNCATYDVFVKRTFNAFDPSINQVMIVPQNGAANHTFDSNTDNSLHTLNSISASTRIYYLLYAGSNGLFIDNATTQNIVDTFLGLFGGSVTGANISSVTSSGSTVSWTDLSGSTDWDVEYGVQGFSPGAGTVVNTLVPTYNITGLLANTNYDVYITPNGGSCSASTGPLPFTTLILCPEPTLTNVTGLTTDAATLNWTAGGLESMWDVEWDVSGFVLGSGNSDYGLLTNSDALTGLPSQTNFHWYVRAVCDLNMGDGVDTTSFFVGPLSFATGQICADPTGLNVSNITAFETDIDWTPGALETEWNVQYGEAGFTLSGVGATIMTNVTTYPQTLSGLTPNTTYEFYVQAVCGSTADSLSAWVGPISWTTDVYCLDPSGLLSSGFTTTGATITWTAGGLETDWTYEYGLNGFTPGTGTSVSTTSTTANLTGLTPGTSYCYYVQSNCGSTQDSSSNWVGPNCFMTLVACPDPTNLGIINLTNTAANFLWQAGGTETMWNIEYGLPGFAPGVGEEEGSVNGTTNNPHYVTTLNASNSYDFYVQADCGGIDGTSQWVGPYSFNTLMPNDMPCDAIELGVDGIIRTYSNVLATNNGEAAVVPGVGACDDNMSWCGYAQADAPMWFKFKATASGTAYVSTSNDVTTNYNSHTEIAIYSVALCENYASYTLLAANTGSNVDYSSLPYIISEPGSDAYICGGLTPGEDYYIMVDGFTSELDPNGWGWWGSYTSFAGPFGISISDVPAVTAGVSLGANICENSGSFDLFQTINGNSSTDGVWYNPDVQPGNEVPSVLDFTGIPVGTYPFFYVDGSACGSDTVETSVTVEEGPEAGSNGVLTTCNTADIWLITQLQGNPSMGGTWSDDDNTGGLHNGLFIAMGVAPGIYNFTYTVSGGGACADATATVTITLTDCLGLETEGTNQLSVYPNPVTDILTIQNLSIEGSAVIDVLDIQGKVVSSTQVAGVYGNYNLDMKNILSGVYIVRITTQNSVEEVRVVKQ